MIFDEIPNSLGRTGRGWFSFEMFDIIPDILVLGKGLGGGILPLSAIVTRSEYNEKCKSIALGHYTHEKNPVLCAAGLATLQTIENEGLIKRAFLLGEKLKSEIEGWKN